MDTLCRPADVRIGKSTHFSLPVSLTDGAVPVGFDVGSGEAESEQREALSILEKLGAAPALRALRTQMRDQGIRGVPRGLRNSTQRNRSDEA